MMVKGEYVITKGDFVEVRIFDKKDIVDQVVGKFLFIIAEPPFIARIENFIYENLSFSEFIKKVQEMSETIVRTTSLPMQMADLDGSDASIMDWVKQYGISWHSHDDSSYLILPDNKGYVRLRSMKEFRWDLDRVKAAVLLLQLIGKKEAKKLEEVLRFRDGKIFLYLQDQKQGREIELNRMNLPNYDGKDMLSTAALLFTELVRAGSYKYPTRNEFSIYDFDSERPLKIKDEEVSHDVMSFIWRSLKEEILSGDYLQWHYKRCADCMKWEDIAQPGRRNTWTRCDSCVEKRRKQQNRERAKKARELKIDRDKE